MDSLKKISDLADKFELKIYGQVISQQGTTELFFDSDNKQVKFAADAQAAVQNVLVNYWNKTQKPSSFDLKIKAEPKQGASFLLTVNPPVLKGTIAVTLDKVFKNLMGVSMAERQKFANTKAKEGAGSGVLNVASLDVAD